MGLYVCHCHMPKLPENTCQTHSSFLEDEYCNLQQIIYEYDKAIIALTTGNHSSYQIDTGMTSQRVTRLDLAELRATRKEMMAELDALASRLGKNRNVVVVTPGF